MTGNTTLRTTTDITTILTDTITIRTASEVLGTGAVISTLGTGTHGHITHGDTAAGTITEDGTTHGITTDIGDSMTLGIMEDGTATITIHTIADGTADGTLITTTDISMDLTTDIITQEVLPKTLT